LYKQIPITKDDLISRYGLILAVQSNSNESDESVEEEREKIRHILDRGESGSFADDDYVPEDLLQKYIYYAQRTYPVLSEGAKQEIEDAYMRLFEMQDEEQNFVKPRHANALTTLSIGFAKMNLCNEVKKQHVESALEFFRRCYSSIGFEIGRDDMGEMTAQNTRRKKKVISYLEDSDDERAEVQKLIEELDLTEEDVEETVSKLNSEGETFEPENGVVKLL
jgi:DNA replicative helicase MCM subunit Mcm2 (Cdc46/Mcm family)